MNLDVTLTTREGEIVKRKAWGASSKMIANDLGIAKKTVENHTNNIYRKAGLQSATQLSAWYFCKAFGINPRLNPLLALFFFLMIGVNEFNTDKDCFRVRTTRTSKVRRKENRL